MRMSHRVLAHQQANKKKDVVTAPIVLAESASEPVMSTVQASPRVKLDDAKKLDGQLNGPA